MNLYFDWCFMSQSLFWKNASLSQRNSTHLWFIYLCLFCAEHCGWYDRSGIGERRGWTTASRCPDYRRSDHRLLHRRWLCSHQAAKGWHYELLLHFAGLLLCVWSWLPQGLCKFLQRSADPGGWRTIHKRDQQKMQVLYEETSTRDRVTASRGQSGLLGLMFIFYH